MKWDFWKDVEPRYETRAAIANLSKELGIAEDPYNQDWAIENANSNRVDPYTRTLIWMMMKNLH